MDKKEKSNELLNYENIDQYIKTRDIEFILSLYFDQGVRNKIKLFVEDKNSKNFLGSFKRIYPSYDELTGKVFFKYLKEKNE